MFQVIKCLPVECLEGFDEFGVMHSNSVNIMPVKSPFF
jgi:hypothetical protein